MDTISDKEFENFRETIEEIKMQNTRILLIMESDDKTNQKGLVETVYHNEKLLSELLTREKVYKAKATTWGVIGGAIVSGIIYLGKFLFTKIFL